MNNAEQKNEKMLTVLATNRAELEPEGYGNCKYDTPVSKFFLRIFHAKMGFMLSTTTFIVSLGDWGS